MSRLAVFAVLLLALVAGAFCQDADLGRRGLKFVGGGFGGGSAAAAAAASGGGGWPGFWGGGFYPVYGWGGPWGGWGGGWGGWGGGGAASSAAAAG